MCGITGFTGNIKNKENIIKNMNNIISHRGPNDDGFYIDNNVALGHRRLSIIDIEGGHQPITINGYTIIYNGEIYNYKELKKDLYTKGYKFKTQGDTEVLLNGFIEYKEKILDKLNGMFSFAIYSQKDNILFFSRDRFGIKPFHYTLLDNEFIFGSEIKSILKYPGFKKEINKKVINSYFQYRYIIGEETFFRGIKKLLPGYYGIFDLKNKKLNLNKYWDLEVCKNKEDLGENYYLEEVEKLLKNSINYRMISDVPIGAYLSGGLDSSLVSAIMQKESKTPIRTYTIGFNEKGFNEFEFSRKVSKYIHSNHKEILLTGDDYIKEIENLIKYKDAPLSVPNEVALYLMSKELKKDITVVLSGEGADELFGGYGRIFKLYLESLKNNSELKSNFIKKYNYTSDKLLLKILDSSINKQIKKYSYTNKIFTKYFDKIKPLDIRDKIPYIFQKLHLPGLLERVDITTMAVGVEARVPFVDYKLVEFVNKIPYKYKVKWKELFNDNIYISQYADNIGVNKISENYDIPKYLLKKLAEKYLPKDIIYRKKVGFPVPLDKWFKGQFIKYAKDILLDKRTLDRGIYNKEYLISCKWLEDLSGITIWMMINLELFFRIYFD